jgi:hypothetical protein
VVPRSAATRQTVSATSSPRSTSTCAPSTVASRTQRVELFALVRRRFVRADPEDVELALQALGRAPGPPYDALGPGRRLDEGEQALADGLRGGALEHEALVVAYGLAVEHESFGLHGLGDLAQCHLAQSGQVLDLEEVVERRLDALARVDLAGAEPLDQRLGREVDEDDLVGLAEDAVGQRLAYAGARDSVIWSLSDSRCCTLTVEWTSMPASSMSRTSS